VSGFSRTDSRWYKAQSQPRRPRRSSATKIPARLRRNQRSHPRWAETSIFWWHYRAR